MWRLVADPARTAFNIVTLPEEMSVNEAIDLHQASAAIGLPHGKVIVNGVHPDFFPGAEAALLRARARASDGGAAPVDPSDRIARAALDAAVSSVARRQAHVETIAKLAAGLPLERIELPFLFSPAIAAGDLAALAGPLDGL
jgi:anion-transporting  ArsA/GET3 family ATPase